jgi:hypothetical protein
MQPVQLSLLPDPHPRTTATLVERLPAEAVATAITLLATLIAKAGGSAGTGAAGDE